MRAPFDEQAMADLLPGTWIVAATNIPMLPSGQRRDPKVEYELLSRDPLVLSDSVPESAGPGRRAGGTKRILGRHTFRGDGFQRRGTGLHRIVSSRWRVAGISPDGTIVVIHFSHSRGAPAGVDIIVREGVDQPEVRAVIAHATERYGLTPEQFATLSWVGTRRRR